LPGDNRTQRGKWTLVFFRFLPTTPTRRYALTFNPFPAIALLQAVRFSSNTFARYPRSALFYLCPDLFGGSRTPNLTLAASYYQPDELERILADMDEKTRGRPYCIDVLFANKVGEVMPMSERLKALPKDHIDFVEKT
jgi:hypothetical protein